MAKKERKTSKNIEFHLYHENFGHFKLIEKVDLICNKNRKATTIIRKNQICKKIKLN